MTVLLKQSFIFWRTVLAVWLGLVLAARAVTVTIVNGTGGGNFPQGTVIAIAPVVPSPLVTFDRWLGGVANVTTAASTFTVPATNTVLTATFRPLVAPRWELWADKTNGLQSGNYPSLAIGPNHDIYYTYWLKTPTGKGRVWRAAAATPKTFTLMPQTGFNLTIGPNPSVPVQNNVNNLTFSANGDLLANCAALNAWSGAAPPLLWRYNAGTQTWSAASISQYPGGSTGNTRRLLMAPNGQVWCVGDSNNVLRSTDHGVSYTNLNQQSLLPSNLRSGGPPLVREFGLGFLPASLRHPLGVVLTVGENNGVVFSANGGTSWASVDPAYLTAFSPLARVHPSNDLALPPTTTTGLGDAGGLGTTRDGRIVVQGATANGYGAGSDGVRLYRFEMERHDLPVLVASGIADRVFGGGQVAQSHSIVRTASGRLYVESPAFPANGQGGIYTSADGLAWTAINDGLELTAFPRFASDTISSNLSSGGRASLAVDGDDVFTANDEGQIFHTVAPGTHSVSGTVRDAVNAPLAGALVQTAFGAYALTDAAGSYTIGGIGSSIYPSRIIATHPSWAFAEQSFVVNGAHSGVNFTGTAPVLTSIKITPAAPTVVAGSSVQLRATALDQFGHALASQPAVTWSANAPAGRYTAPSGSAGSATVTATSGAISGSTGLDYVTTSIPWVETVSPASGVVTGGTAVTVTGVNFNANTTVLFAGQRASGVVVLNANTITCTMPDMSRSPQFGTGGLVHVSAVEIDALGNSGEAYSRPEAFTALGTPTQTFALTLRAGTTGGLSQTNVKPGTTITITADAPPGGQTFYAWSGGGTGTLGDRLAATTTFTMPAHDTTLVATFRRIPTLPQVAAPALSQSSGTVSLTSATAGADIYYTLDSSTPASTSFSPDYRGTLYTGPFNAPAGTIVRAIAAASDRADSVITATTVGDAYALWLLAKFGAGANPADTAALADPDGDGLSNLAEYALDTAPLGFTPPPTASLTSGQFTLTFTRSFTATDATIIVETTSDLTQPWTPGSTYSLALGDTPATAATTELSRTTTPTHDTITVGTNTTTNSTRFLRLRITRP